MHRASTIDFIVWVGVDPNGSNLTLQTLACLEACLANNARIEGTIEYAHVSPHLPMCQNYNEKYKQAQAKCKPHSFFKHMQI